MAVIGELLVSNDLLINAADNTLTIHYFQKCIWRRYKIVLFHFRSCMCFDHSKDEHEEKKSFTSY